MRCVLGIPLRFAAVIYAVLRRYAVGRVGQAVEIAGITVEVGEVQHRCAVFLRGHHGAEEIIAAARAGELRKRRLKPVPTDETQLTNFFFVAECANVDISCIVNKGIDFAFHSIPGRRYHCIAKLGNGNKLLAASFSKRIRHIERAVREFSGLGERKHIDSENAGIQRLICRRVVFTVGKIPHRNIASVNGDAAVSRNVLTGYGVD